MQDFNSYLKDLKEGKEFLNEGELPTKLISQLIRSATWSMNSSNGMLSINSPTMESIAFALGVNGDENLADNKEVLEVYEKVQAAYTKAKTSFITTLNKELKGIK